MTKRSETRGVYVALVAGILSFSISASADWQGTVWGMSVEEANKNFSIPHHLSTKDDYDKHWAIGTMEVSFTYTLGDLEFFKGALLFQNEKGHYPEPGEPTKLAAISMELKDKDKCDTLFEIMRRLYGKPSKETMEKYREDQGGGYHHSITWYDEKNHNEVSLRDHNYDSGIEPDCDISPGPRTWSIQRLTFAPESS